MTRPSQLKLHAVVVIFNVEGAHLAHYNVFEKGMHTVIKISRNSQNVFLN